MIRINKEKQAAAAQSVLHELFDYNELTGEWVNRVNRGNRAKKGQPAGSLSKGGYVVIRINGYIYYAHRLAWTYVHGDFPNGEQPFIDHINGERDDNRLKNLKISSRGENQRNMKMSSKNTSGIVGVTRIEKKRPSGKINHYWMTHWCDENGKPHCKSFSIHTYREEEAKQLAIDYRTEQIRLLELNHGIIYSNRHGT